jgi:hypothetical protein
MKVRKIKLFVASPGDVKEERDRLEELVGELNRTIGSTNDLYVELVRWETHARPGFGADAQDVINTQIEPVDIFVGIMWTRFGTPTNRAASGTEEEFERAYNMWKISGQPKILFYFNKSPFFPRDVDAVSQLQKVISFRQTLQERGGLVWEYQSPDEFIRFAREHFTKELLEIAGRNKEDVAAKRTKDDNDVPVRPTTPLKPEVWRAEEVLNGLYKFVIRIFLTNGFYMLEVNTSKWWMSEIVIKIDGDVVASSLMETLSYELGFYIRDRDQTYPGTIEFSVTGLLRFIKSVRLKIDGRELFNNGYVKSKWA